ncbi:MAG: hypothetical protein ABJ056_15280 [Halioglobus sp.]
MILTLPPHIRARQSEYRIIGRLLQKQQRPGALDLRRRADRVIGLGVTIVAVAVLGSVLQELMWAVLAGGSVIALGVR